MRFYDNRGNMMVVPLESMTENELMEAGWQLNRWVWPSELPGKPNDFDDLHDYSTDKNVKTKYTSVGPIIDAITKIVGLKKTLWYHNVIKDKFMTEEEFQAWWIEQLCSENSLVLAYL